MVRGLLGDHEPAITWKPQLQAVSRATGWRSESRNRHVGSCLPNVMLLLESHMNVQYQRILCCGSDSLRSAPNLTVGLIPSGPSEDVQLHVMLGVTSC